MKTVFLVDDDELINFVHEKIIRTSHLGNIVKFTCPTLALQQLKEFALSASHKFPGIIFLDINMPGMSGWEFLEQLERLPDYLLAKCNIVMLSSSIDNRDVAKSKTYRAVKDFVTKPLTLEKLAILSHKKIV